MSEVLFYHLIFEPLEHVLPGLLERSLERGWRVVVQCGSDERVDALNQHLWTYRDESFLPHGSRQDGMGEQQPIWLTAENDNPNSASVRFLVDGATVDNSEDYERVVIIFDGNNPDAVSDARQVWKVEKEKGHAVTYWAQNEQRRWEKKA